MDLHEANRINTVIAELDSEVENGKIVNYLGWWWRDLDWDMPIVVSFPPFETGAWIDVARKWDYPTRTLTPDEQEWLWHLLGVLADTRTFDAAKAVNKFLKELS